MFPGPRGRTKRRFMDRNTTSCIQIVPTLGEIINAYVLRNRKRILKNNESVGRKRRMLFQSDFQ